MKQNNLPKIVVITGAESTGKSTLTEGLARYFNVPFVPEIARTYVENLERKYTFSDVEIIAEMQVKQFNEMINENHPVIFMDTWLIITKIWFEVVFKKLPGWLNNEIKSNYIDLFLVCDTDLPWIPDSVRENGGNNRLILQEKYIQEITKNNFKYEIISGLNEIRLNHAIQNVKKLL